jgi:hypothetical protein
MSPDRSMRWIFGTRRARDFHRTGPGQADSERSARLLAKRAGWGVLAKPGRNRDGAVTQPWKANGCFGLLPRRSQRSISPTVKIA